MLRFFVPFLRPQWQRFSVLYRGVWPPETGRDFRRRPLGNQNHPSSADSIVQPMLTALTHYAGVSISRAIACGLRVLGKERDNLSAPSDADLPRPAAG